MFQRERAEEDRLLSKLDSDVMSPRKDERRAMIEKVDAETGFLVQGTDMRRFNQVVFRKTRDADKAISIQIADKRQGENKPSSEVGHLANAGRSDADMALLSKVRGELDHDSDEGQKHSRSSVRAMARAW